MNTSCANKGEQVVISKSAFESVCKEVDSLKNILPSVLNLKSELLSLPSRLNQTQIELQRTQQELLSVKQDSEHWKARYESCQSESMQEKEGKFKLLQEIQQVNTQLSQQSEFCSQLGAAIGTILWRVSKSEETIPVMLLGTKTDEFLKLVSVTLESFVSTFKDEMPEEISEETQFIQALCGIITNIAASPTGRDFLMSCAPGKHIIDTIITFLSDAPNSHSSACVKNLLLMTLYNISINQKGLKYIGLKPGIVGLLVWLIQEQKEPENRLHSLKLIQSLVCENDNRTILDEAKEVMSLDFLQQLSLDKNRDIQSVALEMITDVHFLFGEQ